MALTKKYVSGATFLTALAVALFVFPTLASAETGAFSLSPQGILTVYYDDGFLDQPAIGSVFLGYNNTYPATTTEAFGYSATFSGDLYYQVVCSVMGNCIASTTNSLTLDMETGSWSAVNGTYWLKAKKSSTQYDYFPLVRNAENDWNPVNSAQDWSYTGNIYNTRFTDADLTTSTSSGSTTLSFNVDYLIDSTEVNENDPKFYPSQVRVALSQAPSINYSAIAESILPLTATGTIDVEFDDIPDGTYDFVVNFWNYATVFDITQKPFDRSYVYGSVTITGGAIVNVALDPLYNALTPPSEQKRACSITELDGCLYNGFSALFVPSDVSLDNFLSLRTSLESKFPFAYAFDFTSAVTSLYSTAQTATSTITVPFASFGNITLISKAQIEAVPYASTIKQLLGWLMWISFAYLMYYKTLRIFNPSPQ